MRAILFAITCAWLPAATAADPADSPAPAAAKAAEAPAQPVTALLLGEQISAKAEDELTGTIVATLFKRYVEEMKLRATDAEIDAFNNAMELNRKSSVEGWKRDVETLEKELKSTTLSEEERKKKTGQLTLTTKLIEGEKESDDKRKADPAAYRESHTEIARQFIVTWKINQSLFEKYGGRVIFQQAGPEPMDAYRDFLKAREKAGDFKINGEETSKKFWEYFTDDKKHTFYEEAEGKRVMTTPWWLGKK